MNETFKALSDPTRRQIIRLLRERDMTAGEIADHFAMTKPSISHHLNVLKQAKLVLDERQGQNIVYSLNTTVVQEVIGWFLEIIGSEAETGKSGDDEATDAGTRPEKRRSDQKIRDARKGEDQHE